MPRTTGKHSVERGLDGCLWTRFILSLTASAVYVIALCVNEHMRRVHLGQVENDTAALTSTLVSLSRYSTIFVKPWQHAMRNPDFLSSGCFLKVHFCEIEAQEE